MLSLLGSKRRVLLLDDDLSMQRLVSTLLRRNGYRVDVVSNGRDALERIEQFNYDALLLDVMTPTEGAVTVIRTLREKKPELLGRVVLVTGATDSLIREPAKDVYAVLHKPFETRQLLELVSKLVAK
jgi:CheY-like chemotaxis protein